MRTRTNRTENWTEGSIELINTLLDLSESVTFTPEFEIDNHHFGQIKIIKNPGTSVDAATELLSHEHAIKTEQFRDGI